MTSLSREAARVIFYPVKTFIALLIAVVLTGAASADPASGSIAAQTSAQTLRSRVPGLSTAEIEKLRNEGSIRFHSEDRPIEFRYLPRTSISAQVRAGFRGFEPNVVNEVLYLLPMPQPDEDLLLHIYNTLRSVSTLSGVQYHSGHYDRERVLFDNVYAMDSARSRNRIPDPLVTSVPRESSFPVHLVDANFGTSYFEATYYGAGDAISFGLTNSQSLTYIIPVIRTERLRFQLLALPLEDELLLYGVVGVEAGGLIRRRVHLPSAFRRRIETLADWFIEQAY